MAAVLRRLSGLHAVHRLVWVDVARGLALVSMFVAHAAPSGGTGGVLHLTEFLTAAPAVPGIVAVVAEESARAALGLTPAAGDVLAVDVADESLQCREVRAAFQSGRTGVSPLRQAFAALLAGELGLDVERTSPGAAGVGFALTPESEETLTAWMREHLTLRAWVAQDASALEGVAREVAADLAPALQPGALEAPVTQRVAAMRASARRSATL